MISPYTALAGQIMHPDRRRRAEAEAVVAGWDGAAAWRELTARAFFEPAWAADRRRGFRDGATIPCPRCKGHGAVGGHHGEGNDWEDDASTCSECETAGVLLAPAYVRAQPTAQEAVALAADAPGVAHAERRARECAAALVPWGVPAAQRIVWRVGGPVSRHWPATLLSPALEVLRALFFGPWSSVTQGADELARAVVPAAKDPGGFRRRAAWHVQLHACWVAAADAGCVIPARGGHDVSPVDLSRHPLVGRRLADLPSPFAPLLRLWECGYALDEIDGSQIHLVAPPL